jgi:hypothetical protein
MILLRNHKHTEFGKPHANRGPVCASEVCQCYGEPYFAGAAFSINEFLPQIPRLAPLLLPASAPYSSGSVPPARQMTDPTSRHRGRSTETRQQISENNLRTESNIWSQVPELARYLDILKSKSKSKSKLPCGWRSVSQYVLVSSPLWGFWPDDAFLWNIYVWSLLSCLFLGRPLWREVGSVIS